MITRTRIEIPAIKLLENVWCSSFDNSKLGDSPSQLVFVACRLVYAADDSRLTVNPLLLLLAEISNWENSSKTKTLRETSALVLRCRFGRKNSHPSDAPYCNAAPNSSPSNLISNPSLAFICIDSNGNVLGFGLPPPNEIWDCGPSALYEDKNLKRRQAS